MKVYDISPKGLKYYYAMMTMMRTPAVGIPFIALFRAGREVRVRRVLAQY